MSPDTAVSRILNGATSQDDREAGAPAPDKVAVDGRSVAQLIAFAARYGALVNFYDLHDAQTGDWVQFFAADEAVTLATHAALDLPRIERDLQRELARARTDRRRLGGVVTVLARLLAILDRSPVEPDDAEAHLRHPDTLGRQDPLTDPLRRLHGHLGSDRLADALGRRGGDGRWNDSLFEILDDIAVTLITALRRGYPAAIAALDLSLARSGHAPQAALWNTFATLFDEARTELNGFPRRLVDFYYGEVLQQHGVAAQPDTLFLTFTPAQPADQSSVPRGARFPAGTDADGAAIDYAADTALEVTPAKVIGLSVHRVTPPPAVTSGAVVSTTPSPAVLTGDVVLDPSAPETIKPFPMFGGGLEDQTGSLKMKAASLGFSISSPTLTLAGGARSITLGLVVVSHDFGSNAGPPPGQVAALLNLAELVALSMQQTFALYYSTAGGWIEVDHFTVTPHLAREDGQDSRFVIRFDLPADAPPLVSLDTKPAAAPPPGLLPADTFPDPQHTPTVIGNLRADAASTPAAMQLAALKQDMALRRLEIGAVTIDVAVGGLSGVKLSTPNGPADTSQNFALFGLPPARGAALDITAPELFVKAIETLSVAISWAGLPVTSTGFKGYYQDYVLDADGKISPAPLFDNRSFRASFSMVNPGPWTVAADAPSLPLFATEPLTLTAMPGPVPSVSMAPPPSATSLPEPDPAAPLAPDILLQVPVAPVASDPPYYDPKTSALRLTLVEPPYAFGNILYTSNLMAASTALGQAAVGGLPNGGHDGKGALGALGRLAKTNGEAPEKTWAATVDPAIDAALSAMTGEALVAVRQAIAKNGGTADTQAKYLASLDAALADVTTHSGSLWQRLTARGVAPGQPAAVLANLVGWLDANQAGFGAGATVPLKQARNILDAASAIAAAQAASAGQPVAVARPNMAAAAQLALTALMPPSMPNPPWLPMASALTLNYTAHARYRSTPAPSARQDDVPLANALVSPAVPGEAVAFMHVEPFDKAKSPTTTGAVGLLPAVDPHDALYIQLSQPVDQVALLFILAAGADGWWSKAPPIEWSQHADGKWQPVSLLGDGTNNLSNSGIITLQLLPDQPPDKAIRLRVRALGDTTNAPLVKAVIANALTASWVGPGGAATLGMPLAPKTISKSLTNLTNIGSIEQPMQSFGGRPPATGAAFQMWMAERLRHKGYGVTGWDYARMVLEAEPSLWQVAVVPATDGATGLPAPGDVWIVAVAGKNTPNVVDPTTPLVDLTMLSDIGDLLKRSASPFINFAVTNPPYLRLKVTAECDFSDGDTPDFWRIQLDSDLKSWLSPWHDPRLGPRPKNYYTRRAVAEFVRHRPYVKGIISLEIAPEKDDAGLGWYYLTSATEHDINTLSVPRPTPATSGVFNPSMGPTWRPTT